MYPKERGTWTVAHRDWLAAQRFDEPALALAYIDSLAAVDGLMARRVVLEQHLSQIATTPELWPTRLAPARVSRHRHADARSGWSRRSATSSASRGHASSSAWLGLVPSIHQSGESITRGGITKTGSQHARRLLVEAAWHYLRPPRVGQALRNRQDGQPAEILEIAWRAQQRLYRTHTRLRERGKPGNVATVAAARELAGFIWAAATA